MIEQTQREYSGRLLFELIQNAYDREPRDGEGGWVIITLAEDEGDHGTLYAANTGRGFDALDVRRIGSLGLSDKRVGEGSGPGGDHRVDLVPSDRFGIPPPRADLRRLYPFSAWPSSEPRLGDFPARVPDTYAMTRSVLRSARGRMMLLEPPPTCVLPGVRDGRCGRLPSWRGVWKPTS